MHKHVIIISLSIAIIAIILSSCVSTSTYDNMVAKRDSLRVLSDSLSVSSDSLQKVLILKNAFIEAQQRQIAEHRKNLKKLSGHFKNLRENYEDLKSGSSEELQKYLSKIEKLQVDIAEKTLKINEINNILRKREARMNALKQSLADALVGFADKGLSVSVKDGKVYVSLSNKLLFASGSTAIDKNGKDALLGLASVLNTKPDINVLVEGHTDNQAVRQNPRFADNWDLSVLRATEVVRFLTDNGGVDPRRITASGHSEFSPVRIGDDPDSRAANRRTEIILTPKLDELLEIIKK